MNRILLALAMFALPGATFAQTHNQTKSPSQPQLVVIPKGHTRPVPYEAVRAWGTGKYLTFSRMPCMPGVHEPRSEFNKPYACHALPWLEQVRDLSRDLYERMTKVANTTPFNLLDHYILWTKPSLGDGEMDFKSYEKAAYYNGEIVISIPVLENLGSLGSVLTKEQNQGLILFQLLLNAVHPEQDQKWMMNLGEVFVRRLIFKQSKQEAMVNLGIFDLRYILGEKDLDLLARVLREIREIRPTLAAEADGYLFVLEHQLRPGRGFEQGYLEYVQQRMQSDKGRYGDWRQFNRAHQEYLRFSAPWTPSTEWPKIFDQRFLLLIQERTGIPYYERFDDRIDGPSPSALEQANRALVNRSVQGALKSEEKLRLWFASSSWWVKVTTALLDVVQAQDTGVLEDGEETRGKLFVFLWRHTLCDYWRNTGIVCQPEWFLSDFADMARSRLPQVFQEKGYDYHKTLALFRWARDPANYQYGTGRILKRPPLHRGDRILYYDIHPVYPGSFMSAGPVSAVATVLNCDDHGCRTTLPELATPERHVLQKISDFKAPLAVQSRSKK